MLSYLTEPIVSILRFYNYNMMKDEFNDDNVNELLKKYNLFIKNTSYECKFACLVNYYLNLFVNISELIDKS